jgi:adenylosuccinate synthase
VNLKTDVVLDVSRGDCAKAKIVHSLLRDSIKLDHTKYDQVLRWNGAQNAGHTLYHNGFKFITHMVPAGIFFNIPSIIGNNCILHPQSFLKEISSLQEQFNTHTDLKVIDIASLIKIDYRTFIIEDKHIEEDGKDTVVGTTKCGVGPAVRDKYARIGKQAKDISSLKPFLSDTLEDLDKLTTSKSVKILAEGAQGFYLDPNFSEYPYCTSSHCTIGSLFLNGIPPKSLGTVFGAAKVYETYVGNLKFQPEDPIFKEIAQTGKEFGSTTGRLRQCRWLNMNEVIRATKASSVDVLIFSKLDVFKALNVYKLTYNNELLEFTTANDFTSAIKSILSDTVSDKLQVIFSESPYEI